MTAEKFSEEIGYNFTVPEGVEDVKYIIDNDTHRGSMEFVLDGVVWNARAKHTDGFADINNLYVEDNWEEIDCDFNSNQIMNVNGADPEVKYYRIHYNDNSEAYMFSAMWFLEDEKLMISLVGYSEKNVHTMPVEVFG